MGFKNGALDKPVVVAIEGADFCRFVCHRIGNQHEFADVKVWNLWDEDLDNPKSPKENFRQLIRESNFVSGKVRALGLIVDAEDIRADRERFCRDLFATSGLPVPNNQLALAGTQDSIKAGYLVVPHDEQSGCIEHSILKAAAVPQEQVQCVEAYCACVAGHIVPPPNNRHLAKIKVRSLMPTVRGNPGISFGRTGNPGIGLWDWDHESLRVLLEFIRLLINS